MEQMMLDFFRVKEGDTVVYQGDRMTVRKCSAEWFSAVKEKDKSALIFRYAELGNRVFKE